MMLQRVLLCLLAALIGAWLWWEYLEEGFRAEEARNQENRAEDARRQLHDRGGPRALAAENELPEVKAKVDACASLLLANGILLSDRFYDPPDGPTDRPLISVRVKLIELRAYCKNGVIYDGQGREIRFYRPPPSPGRRPDDPEVAAAAAATRARRERRAMDEMKEFERRGGTVVWMQNPRRQGI
jgi:hypothetical protein